MTKLPNWSINILFGQLTTRPIKRNYRANWDLRYPGKRLLCLYACYMNDPLYLELFCVFGENIALVYRFKMVVIESESFYYDIQNDLHLISSP